MPLQSRQTVLVFERDRTAGRQIQVSLETAGFHVPRPCTTAADAVAAASSAPPDVVVMDLSLLDAPGPAHEFVQAMVGRRVPIVYLAPQADRTLLERAVAQHAAGCLVRPLTDRQLVAEVYFALAAARQRATRPDLPAQMTADEKLRLVAAIVSDHPRGDDDGTPRTRRFDLASADPHHALSARERQIVELLANGARVSTIAQRLQLSPHTVRNHLKSVFRKLNLHGQHELFEYWHEHAG